MQLPVSSIEDLEPPSADRAAVWGRRAFLLLVLVVVLAGAAGLLGVHARHVSDTDRGWTLDLEYAGVARAGLDAPFEATVTHRGGFGDSLVLALTGDYLDIFETQGFHPEPSGETRDGSTLYLTFDAPPTGDTFVVAYDAYIQPSSQHGRSGTLSVMSEQQPVAKVDFTTHLLP